MKQRPPIEAMPKPSREAADAALEEAKRNRIQGPPSVRPKPFGIGCLLIVSVALWLASSFVVGLVAAVCAHRWGLS